jgi:hypothetical protein
MARTTPAQKPRGWASMTFIKDLRFMTGLRCCGVLPQRRRPNGRFAVM